MAYMAFKLVEDKLDLSDDKVVQLEQVFSTVRGIHNHYVTKYQAYTDDEIRRMAKQKEVFPFNLNGEMPVHHNHDNIDRCTFVSMMQIICNAWQDFLVGKRPRPAFKAPRHIQSFWILDTFGVEVSKWSILLPGPRPISLITSPAVFTGTPTAIKVSRDKHGDYYIAGIYEQNAKTPVDDALLTMMGIRLQTALAKYHRGKSGTYYAVRKKEENDVNRMEIAITRMMVLGLMLKRNKTKKEESHEAVSAETV